MLERVDVQRFTEFEKDHNLFLREYNGMPYWQMLRFVLAKCLFSNEISISRKLYSNEGLFSKLERQKRFLLEGIKSRREAGRLEKADFVFFMAGPRHERFYSYWCDSFDGKYFSVSHKYVNGAYSMGAKVFQSAVTYHLRKAMHLLKQDKKEHEFLEELEKKLKKEFGRSLTADGMETMIQKYIVETEVLMPFWEKIFDRVKPKAFVVVCYYTSQLYPAYAVAKKMGIDIVEFQHGTIINHYEYWFEDRSGINNMTPDYFLTFGEGWSEYIKILNHTQIIPVGYPHQAFEIEKYGEVETDDKAVIVYPVEIKEFEELICSFAKTAKKKGYRIFVKLHPNVSKAYGAVAFPLLNSSKDIEMIYDQSKSIYYWLKYGKHHIMTSTTVGIEALAIKDSNICIATGFPHEQCQVLLDEGMARGFATENELMNLIENPMDEEANKLREKFWKGNSTENIKTFFHSLIQQN